MAQDQYPWKCRYSWSKQQIADLEIGLLMRWERRSLICTLAKLLAFFIFNPKDEKFSYGKVFFVVFPYLFAIEHKIDTVHSNFE